MAATGGEKARLQPKFLAGRKPQITRPLSFSSAHVLIEHSTAVISFCEYCVGACHVSPRRLSFIYLGRPAHRMGFSYVYSVPAPFLGGRRRCGWGVGRDRLRRDTA